ncbi:tyrosine-type recombinase/integrase [Photobacterium kasasachensis]|uniref:tyrosine-type recombinase/integrase n=1 Tax=Photobacterium kasasachensis TaxID=2910240 RepID=UPI003D140DFE
MTMQRGLMPSSLQAKRQNAVNESPKVKQEVTQRVNHKGHTTSPTQGTKGTLHFSMQKKVNTYYLRILHYTGSPNRKSVTVSLRTSQRYRAVGNADYLKERLIDGIGHYTDFEDVRTTSRTIARNELSSERERHDWFATDSRQIVRRVVPGRRNSHDRALSHQHAQLVPKTVEPSEREPKITITSLIKQFIADKIASRSWKSSTEYCRKASFTTLEKFIRKLGLHTKHLTDIKRNDLIKVRQAMIDDGFKASTVNLRMGDFVSLFEFAEINELIDKSPAIKLKIRENSPINKKEKAKSIPTKSIPALLQHIDNFAVTRRVQKPHSPYLGWIARIEAITGCRIAELTQLRKADVKQTDVGNWYISIHEDYDGNSVKNSNSIRDVPLVDGAYEFDLRAFIAEVVETLDDDMDYLFRTKGKARNTLSNWFSLAMKHFKGKLTNSISFHSFRHSLSTLCLNKGMPEAFTKLVLGHAGGTITYGLYGAAGVNIDVLYDELVSKVFKLDSC